MVDERISRAIDNDHTAAMKVTNDGRKVGRKKSGTFFSMSNGLFICTFCKKVFKSHYLYRKHLKNHSDKTYVCQICSKGFVHRHYLVNHMTVHNISQVTEYQCHLCSKRFAQKGNLNQHLKFHANKKPFKCNTCGKDFFQQEHLRAHLRHHNNDRPFKCEVCNKSFNIKSSLQRHMNCHTGAKPFICDTCQRGYTRRSVLMLHIQQVHENRKPYQCSECHTCFSQKGNLQAHFRRKHLQPKMDNKREHQREKVRRTIRKQTFKQTPKTSKLTPLKIVPIEDIFTHSQLSKPSNVVFVPANGEAVNVKREPRIHNNTKPVHQVVADSQSGNHESSEKYNPSVNDEDANHFLNKLDISSIETGEINKFLNNNGEFFNGSDGSSQDAGNFVPNEFMPLGMAEDFKEICGFDLSNDLKDWEDFFLSDSDFLNDYDPDFSSSSKFTPTPVKIEPIEEQFSRHPISLCHDYASPLPISSGPEVSTDHIPSNCSRTTPVKKNNQPNQVKKKLKPIVEAAEKHASDRKPLEFTVCMEQKIPCMT